MVKTVNVLILVFIIAIFIFLGYESLFYLGYGDLPVMDMSSMEDRGSSMEGDMEMGGDGLAEGMHGHTGDEGEHEDVNSSVS